MGSYSTYQMSDGGLYIGDLNSEGLPESQEAACAWPDGRSYLGMWVKGQMCGVGKLFLHGELRHFGYWWKGELLHEFPLEDAFLQEFSNDPVSHPSYTPYSSPQHSSPPSPTQDSACNTSVAALVIGNNSYSKSPLNNCVKDAQAIGAKLRSINIDVRTLSNATKSQMVEAIKDLGQRSERYDHVFFFFSGHGLSNQGRHYIIAVDEGSSQSEFNPLSIEEIDEFLSSTDFKNIILVSDACSVIVGGEGNSEMVKSAGRSIMAFSSSLGAKAYDGIPDEHSPFAFGLLQYITQPLNIVKVFQETNKFAMSYALDHEFYQQPMLVISPYFPMDFRLVKR